MLMNYFTVFTTCLLCFIQHTLTDFQQEIYGINLHIADTSGKIIISHGTNQMSISFEEFREVDYHGKTIGLDSQQNIRHTFRNFMATPFQSAGEEYIEYEGLGNNVTAYRRNYTATLVGPGATVEMQVYVFDNTTMFPGANATEYYQVNNGTVKLAFTIKQWPFCGIKGYNCKDQYGADELGEYLDVYIAIQGNKPPILGDAKSRGDFGTRPNTYYYGGGDVTYSYKYFSNNTWNEMAPRFTRLNGKDAVVFRFPRFYEDVYYDPIFNITSTWYISSTTKLSPRFFEQFVFSCVGAIFYSLIY